MKNIFLIVISLLLFACSDFGNKIPMNKAYIIQSITEKEFGGCTYYIKTKAALENKDNVRFIDNIYIIDSVGKFDIGDTVYLRLNKR